MSAHYVYRCLDAQQELIYVGASKDVAARMDQHKASSFWAPQVARLTVRVFPEKQIALDVERQTIKCEQPKYNLHGKKTGRMLWSEADCDAEITMLFSRGIGHGSRSTFDKLFSNYLLRFDHPHRLLDDVTRRLDAFDAEWTAREKHRRAEDEQRTREFRRQEEEEGALHLQHCCACRFGIIVDDELVEQYGGESRPMPERVS